MIELNSRIKLTTAQRRITLTKIEQVAKIIITIHLCLLVLHYCLLVQHTLQCLKLSMQKQQNNLSKSNYLPFERVKLSCKHTRIHNRILTAILTQMLWRVTSIKETATATLLSHLLAHSLTYLLLHRKTLMNYLILQEHQVHSSVPSEVVYLH